MYVIPTLFSSLYVLGAINWYMMQKAVMYLLEVDHKDSHVLFKSILWPWFVLELVIFNLFVHDEEDDEE
tara:strand:+ start:786 stop:992 length:207 start_codon:yes stop_codon:yes gene_type:complete